uniref:Sulfhydryl oxidase n=1 Tax=Caenorhabditis japonica TaxID=281687 RepID=A0A8R1EM96_CAEJA
MELGADGKPCRACVSIEEMMKKGKEMAEKMKKKESNTSDDKNPTPSTSAQSGSKLYGCPVNKDELGRSTWNLLHTMSVYYPEKPTEEDKNRAKTFMNLLGQTYPCDFCAKDLRKDLKEEPPKVESRQEFAVWMCQLHNKVNKKTGKAEFDCKNVMERWRDGWKDGSCDY